MLGNAQLTIEEEFTWFERKQAKLTSVPDFVPEIRLSSWLQVCEMP